MRYLTPGQYAVADDGMLALGQTTPGAGTLARLITRAESAIDAYLGLDLKFGGLDPHVVYGCQQALEPMDEWRRRVVLPCFPAPARNVKRFNIHITNSSGTPNQAASAIINPGDVVLNNVGGYLEAVPLQALTYSTVATVWGLGLAPPIAEFDYESGYYLPVFGDTLYNDSGDLKTYRAVRGFWATSYTQAASNQPSVLPPIPAVVYKNGTVQSSSLYTLTPTEGVVTFTGAQLTTDVITADYTTQIPDLIAEAATEQVTYMLQQRALNQAGAGGLEQVRSGGRFIRRARTDDATEDGLCAKARMKLAQFRDVPLA